MFGLRGPAGRQQACRKPFCPKRCAMPASTLQAIDPFLRPATRYVALLTDT
jgi:hypothetical protein